MPGNGMNRILLVDDEEEILQSLSSLLREEYTVYTATNGDDGFQIIQTEEIHVVIADQRMPGISGTEFLAKVKDYSPDSIRILLTGYSDVDAIIEAINEGEIYKYVSKPWYPDTLRRELREACNRYNLIIENRKLAQRIGKLNKKLKGQVAARTSELQQSRQEQKQTEIKYQQLFNSSHEGFVILKPTGEILDINNAFLKLLALKREETLGKKFWQLRDLFVSNLAQLIRQFRQVVQQKSSHQTSTSMELVNSTGQEYILDFQTNSDDYNIFVIVRDMTNRIKAERALKESEEKFRNMAENSLQGIFIYQNDKFVYINNMLPRIFFMPQKKFMKMSRPELTGLLQPQTLKHVCKKVISLKTGQLNQSRFELAIEDEQIGNIWLEILLGKIIYNGKPAFQGAIMDITERKQHEKEREQLLNELSNRNAELERFVYTVSHDLKTPLVTLKGFTGLLEQDIEQNDRGNIKKDLSFINQACSRMQDLIQDLLELSRIGRLVNPCQEIEFLIPLQEALEQVQPLAQSGKVQFKINGPFGTVIVDRQRLEEALVNLLTNAIKFMGDNRQPLIEIGTAQKNGEKFYFIRDNGIGINPKYHDKIFNLFEQIKTINVEGTGVGLTIVKRIIELHGGRIWVESAENEGSCFCYTLPQKERE